LNRLILFDLDGTLIDPHESITKGVQHTLSTVGIHVEDRNQLNCFIGPPMRESLREFYGFTDHDQIEQMYKTYLEYFAINGIQQNVLYPNVKETLTELQNCGFTLVVATSKLMKSAINIAKYLQIHDFFEAIIGCEPDGSRSRKSDIINYILAKFDPQKQLSPTIIGDRKYDIIGAKESGIASIGVTWGYGTRAELQEHKADHIVDSFAELVQLLKT